MLVCICLYACFLYLSIVCVSLLVCLYVCVCVCVVCAVQVEQETDTHEVASYLSWLSMPSTCAHYVWSAPMADMLLQALSPMLPYNLNGWMPGAARRSAP